MGSRKNRVYTEIARVVWIINEAGYATIRYLYDNLDECILAHDQELMGVAQGQTAHDRDVILNKLIKTKPEENPEERDAIDWYNSLSIINKKRVRWIRDRYDKKLN